MKPIARAMGVLILLASGCFNSASSSGGALDAGISPCNALAPGSTIVDPTSSGGAIAPPAAGGVLAAGSYHLVATTFYPDASCATGSTSVSTVLRIVTETGSTGTLETLTATAASDAVSESVTFTANGSSLSVRIDCLLPDANGLTGATAQFPYTATPTELDLYRSSPGCSVTIDTYALD